MYLNRAGQKNDYSHNVVNDSTLQLIYSQQPPTLNVCLKDCMNFFITLDRFGTSYRWTVQ